MPPFALHTRSPCQRPPRADCGPCLRPPCSHAAAAGPARERARRGRPRRPVVCVVTDLGHSLAVISGGSIRVRVATDRAAGRGPAPRPAQGLTEAVLGLAATTASVVILTPKDADLSGPVFFVVSLIPHSSRACKSRRTKTFIGGRKRTSPCGQSTKNSISASSSCTRSFLGTAVRKTEKAEGTDALTPPPTPERKRRAISAGSTSGSGQPRKGRTGTPSCGRRRRCLTSTTRRATATTPSMTCSCASWRRCAPTPPSATVKREGRWVGERRREGPRECTLEQKDTCTVVSTSYTVCVCSPCPTRCPRRGCAV